MAVNTGVNSSPAPKKSTPVYQGTKGKLGIPQKQRPAPHPSTPTGAGNTPAPKKG